MHELAVILIGCGKENFGWTLDSINAFTPLEDDIRFFNFFKVQRGLISSCLSMYSGGVCWCDVKLKSFGPETEVKRHGSPLETCLNCARLRSSESERV